MSAIQPIEGFATQSGHWYGKDGTPTYEVIGKNGKQRPTTIRDARELGLVPSVTTILRLAAAPNLVKWMREQVAKAAFSQPPQSGEDEATYVARILPVAEEVAATARDRGTEIHGAIEKQDKWGEFAAHVIAANESVDAWAGVQPWAAERSFASPLGYGGKLDLSAPGFVVDFKTSENIDGKKIYDDHARQLAAYRMGLGMPEARCAICFVSSTEPKARLIEVEEEALKGAWEEFKCLLRLFYLTKKLPMPEGL